MIVDFHTHVFPDKIAQKTIAHLSRTGNVLPVSDGTVAGLLREMEAANAAVAVNLPVLTAPAQFESVTRFAMEINAAFADHPRRLISFGGIHPACEDIDGKMRDLRKKGFLGVKIHPDYPDVDDDGDGLVDGTNIPYDDVVSKIGVIDESSNKNLNVVTPPSEIIIKGNEGARKPGKCTFVVYDTSKAEGVSDGGFFGNTKFITDGSEYIGTDYVGKETETYVFRELNTEGL